MTSADLRANFPYTWAFKEPSGYQHQLCRPGEVIGKGRAIIHFFDGFSCQGSLRGCRPLDAPARVKCDYGKTEAELALEIRGYLQTLGFRVHRLKADKYKGSHQKGHEKEDPGTPDYLCVMPGCSVVVPGPLFYSWVFYWEAKREKNGKIGVNQRAWIDDARKRGFVVLEAPRSIEEVDRWLEEQGWLKR
jgi:hypothetical protein